MNKYEITALTPTFESHKRMLNDSVKIIENTNNLKTLLSRYEDALDSYRWIIDAINSGYQAKFSAEKEGFERSLKREVNNSIVRISNMMYRNDIPKIMNLKNNLSKEKRIDKLIDKQNECLNSLIQHFDIEKSKSEIIEVINQLNNYKNTLIKK